MKTHEKYQWIKEMSEPLPDQTQYKYRDPNLRIQACMVLELKRIADVLEVIINHKLFK